MEDKKARNKLIAENIKKSMFDQPEVALKVSLEDEEGDSKKVREALNRLRGKKK